MSYSPWTMSSVVLPNISSVSFDQVHGLALLTSLESTLAFVLDFVPAVGSMIPTTPGDTFTLSPSSRGPPVFLGVDGTTNDDLTRLQLQYLKLAQSNRE